MNHGLVLFIVWIVIWVLNSRSVDAYIKYLYKFKPEFWEKLGKPRGMFFNPKGSSYFAFVRLGSSLKKEIPKCLANDAAAVMCFTKILFWNKVAKWYLILFLPLLLLGAIIF